jgi:hypothetical protein
MRRGASLIELLVCLTIIGTLVGMMLPAVQKVRATANSTACLNNLHQPSLAVHLFHDTNKHLPYPRLCPAPWQGGKDPFCLSAPPMTRTGPAEVWWAPFDNRPGATFAGPAAGYQPAGMLLPFVGNSLKVFRCPDGFDRTPGSPTSGQSFQVSYALEPQMGGRNLAEYVGATIFEHDDAPVCFGPAVHVTAWSADAATKQARHRPTRHLGTLAIASHDGSVSVQR